MLSVLGGPQLELIGLLNRSRVCPDKELSEEEGLGMASGLIWGEEESSRKRKGQPRPSCGGFVSGGCEDSLAVLAVMCARWADGEEGVLLASEGRGNGPEDTGTLALSPGI